MKKILLPVLVLLAGSGVGGAAAFATARLVGAPPPPPSAQEADAKNTGFVPVTKILAPLVLADGRLSGYVVFDVQLEVSADKADFVTARLPLLLHAINMRTYRTPMAAGRDGMLPELGTFRKIVMDAAPEAFGAHVVRLVAITAAQPA